MTGEPELSLDELKREVQSAAVGVGVADAYDALANYIDAADNAKEEGALVAALALADEIEPRCAPASASLVHYARANAWAGLESVRSTNANVWSWDQPELLQQVYWLRSAIQHPGFAELEPMRRAQVHCNLGNALSKAGRFVDALVAWRAALAAFPRHGMARGNLGRGLISYAQGLYDTGHVAVFLHRARAELKQAVDGGVGRDGSTYQEALDYFKQCQFFAERTLNDMGAKEAWQPDEYSLGRGAAERRYRRWALDNRLFINPLNDLVTETIAARDVLTLPSHRADEAGVTYLAFFNQLKEEFTFARWSLFEGTDARRVHFADRAVNLADNSDYALYSIGIEQVKGAFRCAYSLLDKVAYFVNEYWKLGISQKRVNFRSVWVEPVKGGSGAARVRQVLEESKNLPLRGLFWLSKDLFDDKLNDVAQPHAKELDELRNHLEHKYVKVVDSFATLSAPPELFADKLAHQVVVEDLQDKALRMLQIARSALIYLSLAMHVEERRRAEGRGPAMPLPVRTYPDKLKRR